MDVNIGGRDGRGASVRACVRAYVRTCVCAFVYYGDKGTLSG